MEEDRPLHFADGLKCLSLDLSEVLSYVLFPIERKIIYYK